MACFCQQFDLLLERRRWLLILYQRFINNKYGNNKERTPVDIVWRINLAPQSRIGLLYLSLSFFLFVWEFQQRRLLEITWECPLTRLVVDAGGAGRGEGTSRQIHADSGRLFLPSLLRAVPRATLPPRTLLSTALSSTPRSLSTSMSGELVGADPKPRHATRIVLNHNVKGYNGRRRRNRIKYTRTTICESPLHIYNSFSFQQSKILRTVTVHFMKVSLSITHFPFQQLVRQYHLMLIGLKC